MQLAPYLILNWIHTMQRAWECLKVNCFLYAHVKMRKVNKTILKEAKMKCEYKNELWQILRMWNGLLLLSGFHLVHVWFCHWWWSIWIRMVLHQSQSIWTTDLLHKFVPLFYRTNINHNSKVSPYILWVFFWIGESKYII